MGPDGIKGTYDKRHLFSMAGEDRVYTAGKTGLWLKNRVGIFLLLSVTISVFQSGAGWVHQADVLVFVANFPEKRINAWSQLLIARAIENQCYVLG